MKKTIEYWEVEIKFIVKKESYEAKSKQQLLNNIKDGLGNNDMNNIEIEDVDIRIK